MKQQDIEDRLSRLLSLALAGDGASYRAFLGELAPLLRGYLRRRLGSRPDEVEDLVQETLLAVHKQRHTYDPALPVTAWVRALARYKLIDLLRQHGRRDALHEPLDDSDEALGTQADAAAAEASRDLGRLLEALPERQREAIVLTKLEGLSVAEAAARSGQSEAAIKVGVHRGLKALASLIRRST